ncbi:MAG: hypothetical protein M0R47_12485 [Methylobacter sp.]|jgi:hypothetical protein|uniref:hypothetical protein n=1 Tax=Methylobacter sp. TaxID=2051955 RepID=UPI0025DFD03F|nr:hypothetical protein [Methylobacter sp.]MCK9621341.1 hypothetical protein [Methylobacter sp.]
MRNLQYEFAMKRAIKVSMMYLIALIIFASEAIAVTLPKCDAPFYAGQESIKNIGSNVAFAYHLTMMVNESDNGRVAYCLTRSGMSESGLSFGVSQMDLRTNDKAWPVFEKILQKTGGEQKSLAFEEADIKLMRTLLVGKGAPTAKDLLKKDNPSIEALLIRANDALKSSSSRSIIDALHVEHVKNEVDFIARVQKDLDTSSVGGSKLLANSLAAKLLIMDFHNLFGSINNKLKPFLMTGEATMMGHQIKIRGPSISVSDILQFVLNTKQGAGCEPNQRAEVLRRMGYVIMIARNNGDRTDWTSEDREFFNKILPDILSNPCVNSTVDLRHVRKLTNNSF